MRKMAMIMLALSIAACEDEAKTPDADEAKPAEEAVAEEGSGAAAELAALETSMTAIVAAQRDSDALGRRKACLEAVPTLQAAQKKAPEDKKVAKVAETLLPLCFEMVETEKLVEKMAEPKANVQLSAAFANTFTLGDLKKTLKEAKRLAKRGQDPTKKCAEVGVLVDHFGEKKSRKVKKLVKKAQSFCEGPAHLSAARYHLGEAKKAMAESSGNTLVESCVHGVAELEAAPSGKLHDKLAAAAEERCVEAIAFKGRFARDQS